MVLKGDKHVAENTMDEKHRMRCLTSHPVVVVGAITLVGAMLRLYHLGYKPLWLDEAVLYWISRGGVQEIIAHNASSNSAPPLFAILLGLLTKVHDSEAALRSVSVVAGIVSLPAIYQLCVEFVSRRAAYICAALAAIAPFQVTYSQQAREYSLTFLVATLMLLTFTRYLKSPGRLTAALLILTWILGILTQYGLALLALGLNLVYLARVMQVSRRREAIGQWAGAQIPILATCALVWVIGLRDQMVLGGFAGSGYLVDAYWNGAAKSLPRFAWRQTLAFFESVYPSGLLFPFIVCVGGLYAVRDRLGKWAVLTFAVPLAVTFVSSCLRLYPYTGLRQDMFLVPMALVMAAYALDVHAKPQQPKAVLTILLVLLTINGLLATHDYLKDTGNENIRPVVAKLSGSFQPSDRIYVYYGAVPAFTYYYRVHQDKLILGTGNRTDPEQYLVHLDDMLSDAGRVWMVFSHCYGSECDLISAHAAKTRQVELHAEAHDAWLYLAR